MSGGHWGGRFPLGNWACSKFIFAALRWRLFTGRTRNRLKGMLRPGNEQRVNSAFLAGEVKQWLTQGYDKFNIGGGSKELKGFVNLDFVSFPQVSRQIVANILDLSYIPATCASQIHSNHVLEHLTEDQLGEQLMQYQRILKPAGLLTIRCPNALGAAYAFWFGAILEAGHDDFVTLGFPEDEDFGNPEDTWMEKDFYGLLHWFYGDVGNIRNQHLNRLTPSGIENRLRQAGFSIAKMSDPEAINLVVVARKG